MLLFNDAQTLSVSQDFEYLGDTLNYRKVNSFSVRGRFISDISSDGFEGTYLGLIYSNGYGIAVPYGDGDIVPNDLVFNGSGIFYNGINLTYGGFPDPQHSPLYDIWTAMGEVRDRFSDFQEIILNGVSLGSGRVLNFSFPENVDPRKCDFQVDFETYSSGDMFNWTGAGYQNTVVDTGIARFVSSLNESFDFEFLKDNTFNYSRSVDFDLISPGWDYEADIQRAKDFAYELFHGDPAFASVFAQYPDFYQESGKRVYTERYNAIQGSYSFSETFKGPTAGESYYWTNGFSLTIDPEGETSIQEQGSIIGVRVPVYESAMEGMSEVEWTSKDRAADFYAAMTSGCSGDLFLSSSSKKIDRFAGSIDYSFDYVNDPFSEGCFTVNRTNEVNFDENGLITISEAGSVLGRCGADGQEKLNNSIYYFEDNISGNMLGRIFAFYEDRNSGCGCSGSGTAGTGDLRLLSKQHGYSEYNGLFDYNYVYRNDCTSVEDECYIVSVEKEIKDTIHNVFLDITANSGEIAQKQNTSSLLRETQRISVQGQCSGMDVEGYLAKATSKVTPPSNGTYYMDSADYFFDPDNSIFELSVYYNYTGYRPYSSINV